MSNAAVQKLARVTKILRAVEHALDEESRRLAREINQEYKDFNGELGSDQIKKIRNAVLRWRKDLHAGKYKLAGKDFGKVMDAIDDLEGQLGIK